MCSQHLQTCSEQLQGPASAKPIIQWSSTLLSSSLGLAPPPRACVGCRILSMTEKSSFPERMIKSFFFLLS